jgi:hypothetical protein
VEVQSETWITNWFELNIGRKYQITKGHMVQDKGSMTLIKLKDMEVIRIYKEEIRKGITE